MVALPDPLVNLLKSYKEQCTQERLEVKELWEGGKHFFVFSSWHGKPMYPSSITQWWRRFLKRHEFPFPTSHLSHLSFERGSTC
ncbi:hypothetical protein D7Z54_34955 [Salibacterium salarium]|uniref:Uncharacterized protein n=1 Tax=Salibacterium salarium TaxID=284579 RepID=A0A428MRK9_9BACI|nr:hypothetical protein D7Z54_34955 [Salibacterium salarium]